MTEYVELHSHSWGSLLDGTASPDQLVERAAALGMPALALTDHDALYSTIPFITAAQKHNITPILGAELTLESGHHVTLLVESEMGWHNLCTLITAGQMNAPKGEARLPRARLFDHSDGLIALSGCRKGEIAQALLAKDKSRALVLGQEYKNHFKRFAIELQHHLLPDDTELVDDLAALAQALRLPAVATNNVHYTTPDDQLFQDVLVCIHNKMTWEEAHHLHRPNAEYALKTGHDLAPLFAHYPQALTNTLRIAERCTYLPTYGIQDLPRFPTPNGMSANDYLAHLCWQGLRERYGDITELLARRLEHELTIIARCKLSNYFLIVWDVMQFARQKGFLGQARGAAASSLAAYTLYISSVDPIANDLVFERFLSDERTATADIDMDFEAAHWNEMLQYLYATYGLDHTAMACTYFTFQRKSSIRDVAKALGLPEETRDYLAAVRDLSDERVLRAEGISPQTLNTLIALSERIRRFPRHLGIHNGGVILSGPPLAQRLPLEPARKEKITVVQWDKESLEEAGIVKIDVLSLKTLSAIADTLKAIECTTGKRINLEAITDDPGVYRMISDGDTVGIFQVESRAQAQLLPRMKPTCFADLVIAISLIRPGPVQGGMVRPYLRRRLGVEPITCDHPLLEPILKKTLGVVIFQEQVIKIARDLGGFTPGQGEQLRRTLGSKNAEAAIENYRSVFIKGALVRDVPPETAELIFEKLSGFASYSFAEAHALAFAILVRQAAWLKYYYPVEFTTAILNNQPMGFWSPAVIVNDAKRHGISLYAVDVNLSNAQCRIEDKGIRMGFNYVKDFKEKLPEQVVTARGDRPFRSLKDFYHRTRLGEQYIKNLILAGAFDWLGKPRRDLLWELGGFAENPDELPLEFEEEPVIFSPMSRIEMQRTEFQLTGIFLHEHPMEIHRPYLKAQRILDSQAVRKAPAGRIAGSNIVNEVKVAGLNVVHQAPPSAKGFHFITLEDEFGFINIIVDPDIYADDKFRDRIHDEPILVIHGTVQHDSGVTNVLATSVQSLYED